MKKILIIYPPQFKTKADKLKKQATSLEEKKLLEFQAISFDLEKFNFQDNPLREGKISVIIISDNMDVVKNCVHQVLLATHQVSFLHLEESKQSFDKLQSILWKMMASFYLQRLKL